MRARITVLAFYPVVPISISIHEILRNVMRHQIARTNCPVEIDQWLITVFRFGGVVTGTNKYITQVSAHFSVGLMDEITYGPATKVINTVYRDLAITVHHAQQGALTAAESGTYKNPLTIIIDSQQRYEPRLRPQGSAGSTIVLLPVLPCRQDAATSPGGSCCQATATWRRGLALPPSSLAVFPLPTAGAVDIFTNRGWR